MKNNKPNNKEEQKKGTALKPKAPEMIKNVNEKWNALKKYVSVERTLSILEQHLIMRNNEALKMDPTPPSYPPTRTPIYPILPTAAAKAWSIFIPFHIHPHYTE